MCFQAALVFLSLLVLQTYALAGLPLKDTLKLTSVIYRHGDRSPINNFPTDTVNESAWSLVGGYGQLTRRGILQEFNLGRFLRERYDGYLDKRYLKKEIIVRSTDFERTLMSAQSVLAGLYRPEKTDSWNPDLLWEPVPVHTVPMEEDELLLGHNNNECPMVQAITKEIESIKEEFNIKYENLTDLVRNKTGSPNITDFFSLTSVYDTLLCENLHGVKVPDWVPENFFNIMETEIVPLNYYLKFNRADQSRKSVGFFLHKVISDMVSRSNLPPREADKTCKMFMYSAHDTNMGALLNALQVYENRSIPYSTTLMFELHQAPSKTFYVQLWLRAYPNCSSSNIRDVIPKLTQLTVPRCAPDCPLDRFIELTQEVVTDDHYKECYGHSATNTIKELTKVIVIAVVVGSVVVIIVVTLQMFCHHKYCRRKVRRPANFRKLRAEIPEEMPMMTSEYADDFEE